jgi:hypothetical protein
MQKVQCYLYPNRIRLLADLAGFTVENRVVYQRTVKIYQGVDNVIEFDIQNADQKRIDLVNSPLITNLELNVMDEAGNKLPNSPYMITPNPNVKGIAGTAIPASDLVGLKRQYLKYSVTAAQGSSTIPLYCDPQFGAVGTLDLQTNAMPVTRPAQVYENFAGEINFMGNVIFHSSAIPAKYYEAIATTHLNFAVQLNSFKGTIYVEATKDMTISVQSWLNSPQIQSMTFNQANSSLINFNNIAVEEYNWFRVSWTLPQLVSAEYGAVSPVPQMVSSVSVTTS